MHLTLVTMKPGFALSIRRQIVRTLLTAFWLIVCPAGAIAFEWDPAKLDRTTGKLPQFHTKQQRYLLLLFGDKAQHRVWVVDDCHRLYVDANANGVPDENEIHTATSTRIQCDQGRERIMRTFPKIVIKSPGSDGVFALDFETSHYQFRNKLGLQPGMEELGVLQAEAEGLNIGCMFSGIILRDDVKYGYVNCWGHNTPGEDRTKVIWVDGPPTIRPLYLPPIHHDRPFDPNFEITMPASEIKSISANIYYEYPPEHAKPTVAITLPGESKPLLKWTLDQRC